MDDDGFRMSVEAELIDKGLRLRWLCDGTDRLNWRDLQVVIWSAGPESLITQHEMPDHHGWSTTEYLLANVVDAVRSIGHGLSGSKARFEPMWRPPEISAPAPARGEVQASAMGLESGSGFRVETAPMDEMAEWLGWMTPAQKDDLAPVS